MKAHKNIQDDERVKGFVDVAGKYCELIESRQSLTVQEFVSQCAQRLGHLFGAGAALVDVGGDLPGGYCHDGLSRDEWQELRDELSPKLMTHDRYWVVFDPYDKESVCSYTLASDLAEIYRDVKRPMCVFGQSQQGDRAAVGDWRFHFLIHWGRHCVHALTAINCLLDRFEEERIESEPFVEPFMEHLAGEFDTALEAMESAMVRLAQMDMSHRWIVFWGEGQGSRPDSDQYPEVPFSGHTFDLGDQSLNVEATLEFAGLSREIVDVRIDPSGKIALPGANPSQLARFLDAVFRCHFGITPREGEDDYGVCAEWDECGS